MILITDKFIECEHICIEKVLGSRNARLGFIGCERMSTEVYFNYRRVSWILWIITDVSASINWFTGWLCIFVCLTALCFNHMCDAICCDKYFWYFLLTFMHNDNYDNSIEDWLSYFTINCDAFENLYLILFVIPCACGLMFNIQFILIFAKARHLLFSLFVYCIIFLRPQVLQAVICVILGLILDINKVDQQKSANIVNNISLSIVIVVVVINVIISAFDIKAIESQRERAEIVNGTTIAPPSD